MATAASKKPNRLLRSIAFLGNFGAIIFPLGALILLAVPGIWAYQLTQWLQHGRWPSLSVGDALRWANVAEPHFETAAVQQASENLVASPLSLVLLFSIGGALFAYAQFSKWLERRCEPEKSAFE